MFSIIIPLFNKELYIHKCVKSIIDQTYYEFELLIINDGSTDKSLFIIEQFKDARIKVIHQVNSGVSVARNNGVKLAKYPYIAFIDADDWWHPNYLQEMSNLILRYPNAGIYGCKYYWVKNGVYKESINHESNTFKGYIDYFRAYIYAWWMPLTATSVVIPKRVCIEMSGFKENLRFGEDLDFWIRIALKYKVGYLNKSLAFYNNDVDINNKSVGGNKQWSKEEHVVFNLNFLKEEEENNVLLKELLDGIRVRTLIDFYLKSIFVEEVTDILRSIDFSKQPFFYRILYSAPIEIVHFYFNSMKLGSILKQTILRLIP